VITSSPQSAIQSVVEEFVREELSAENAHIAGAVWNMLDAGGKRLRPRITMLAARTSVDDASEDPVLASYMELIHVATLIHDDVLDNADVRRGRESTNHALGNRFSVLAGDYLFSWVFKKVTQGYQNPVPTILAAMLAEICNGEVKQLRAAGNARLAPDGYFDIIGKKTAELFAACAECGAIAALLQTGSAAGPQLRDLPAVRTLRLFGRSFGMAFQIRDDILDYTATEEELGKPAGSDLREKKMTLPLIYALDGGDPMLHKSVTDLFAFEDSDAAKAIALRARTLDLVRRSGGIERAAAKAAEFAADAEAALDRLAVTPARDELLHITRGFREFSSP
jgi:geranylgeranyl pyrophosphate synthase